METVVTKSMNGKKSFALTFLNLIYVSISYLLMLVASFAHKQNTGHLIFCSVLRYFGCHQPPELFSGGIKERHNTKWYYIVEPCEGDKSQCLRSLIGVPCLQKLMKLPRKQQGHARNCIVHVHPLLSCLNWRDGRRHCALNQNRPHETPGCIGQALSSLVFCWMIYHRFIS